MKTKYRKILERFEQSGMSQKAFAAQEGISPSLVSYYLKKSRDDKQGTASKFTPIEFEEPPSEEKTIQITTSKGLKITIPI